MAFQNRLGLGLRLLAGLGMVFALAAGAQPVEINRAAWMPEAPVGGPDWSRARPVELPDDLIDRHEAGAPSWYRLAFTLPSIPAASQSIYFPAVYAQLHLTLNGHALGATGSIDERIPRSWKVTRIFDVPAGYLVAGENVLMIRAGGDGLWTFAPPLIGNADLLHLAYSQKIIATAAAPLAIGAMVSLLGVFVLVLWIHRRGEALYGYFGAANLMWGLHIAWNLLPFSVFPHPHNQVLWTATYAFWVSLLVIFFIRYTGRPYTRLVRFMWGFGLAGYPMLYTAQALGSFDLASGLWRAASIVFVLAGLVIVTRFAWQHRRVDSLLLMATGAVSASFAVRDWWIAQEGSTLNPVWLVPYAGLAFLLLFGWLLASRFNRDIDALERANETLNQRVAEKSRELAQNHERLTRIEQQQAALEERGRILRDMHDGIGTKLMISLRSLERGEMGSPAAAELMHECIDELRLTVDASDQTDGDVAGLLANLRYRLADRLQKAGLQIDWRVGDTPLVPALTGSAGRELLRILQECLGNILKHARASEVRFETTHDSSADEVVVLIRDNGRGFDVEAARRAGHGLNNIRLRAQRMGARLAVSSSPGGTEVRVAFPLGAQTAIR